MKKSQVLEWAGQWVKESLVQELEPPSQGPGLVLMLVQVWVGLCYLLMLLQRWGLELELLLHDVLVLVLVLELALL